jgi:hypothetical protein
LCLAFYNRLAAIVTRLRVFQRERLQERDLRACALAVKDTSSVVHHERMIELLAAQTENVTQRARLIRRALLLFLTAIATLILCAMCCGASAIWRSAIYPAVFAFAAGLLLLLAGVIAAIIEMRLSLGPVELESEVVALLAP